MSGHKVRAALAAWWRPIINVLCIPAAPYALYVGPFIGKPLSDMQMGLSLTFVATLYAIREWGKAEALKQVATASQSNQADWGFPQDIRP